MDDAKSDTVASIQQHYRSDSVLQHEYMAIHQQRVALVNLMHVWHQIGFPAALVVYATLAKVACEQRCPSLNWIALGLASALLVMVRLYTRRLDAKTLRLYPRLVALEVLLGFHFYRDYLTRVGTYEASSSTFVEEAEKLAEVPRITPDEYNKRVNGAFCPVAYPASRRGHRELDLMAATLILLLAIAALVIGRAA